MDTPEISSSQAEREYYQLSTEARLTGLCDRYNIAPTFNPHTWVSRTDFPEREVTDVFHNYSRYGRDAQEIFRLGTAHFNQMAGHVIEQGFGYRPVTRVNIGDQEAPLSIRSLSFMGENLTSPRAQKVNKFYHEIGHTVMFYEMAEVLKESYLDKTLTQSAKEMEAKVQYLRQSGTPMSRLDLLRNSQGGRFYSDGDLLYEDMTEALSIRFTGGERWERYRRFLLSGDPRKAAVAQEVLAIVDKLFHKAISQSA